MKPKLTFVHALSPLHAGTGQGVGVIDLPIAREKATGIPFLPGSSLKGVLRDRCDHEETRIRIFGPDTDRADSHAGAAHFSDQRLLLLPVRSLKGTFAWVTSPYLLHRLKRDAHESGAATGLPESVPAPGSVDQCVVVSTKSGALCMGDSEVVLEDLDLSAVSGADKWAEWLGSRLFPDDEAWQKRFTDRLCVIHDDAFSFLLTTATEVTMRIKLNDETKTVDTETGALWTEEALPAESILSGMVLATPVRKKGVDEGADKVLTELANLSGLMQLGGNATVGRGFCRVLLG